MKSKERGPYCDYWKPKDTFGSLIRSFRMNRKMTQQEYADFLGVSRRTIISAEQRQHYSFSNVTHWMRLKEPDFPPVQDLMRQFKK